MFKSSCLPVQFFVVSLSSGFLHIVQPLFLSYEREHGKKKKSLNICHALPAYGSLRKPKFCAGGDPMFFN